METVNANRPGRVNRAIGSSGLLAALLVLPVLGVFALAGQESTQEPSTFDGAAIYQGHGCSSCHGQAGEGGAGPALAGNPKLWNDEYVLDQILRGGGGMPSFRHQLSNEQLAAVASFVRTAWGNDLELIESSQVVQRRREGRTEEDGKDMDSRRFLPASGSQLFAWNCMICHGVNGGGGVGPPLTGNENLAVADYVVGQIQLGGGGMPPFAPVLDSDEIAAVASYIRSAWNNDYGNISVDHVRVQWEGLATSSNSREDAAATGRTNSADPPEGRTAGEELYASNGCAGCHSKEGAGGIGPALDGNPALADGAFVVATIRDGRKGMPAFGERLEENDLAVLASYVRTAWSNDYGPVEVAREPDVPESLRRSQIDPTTAGSETGAALYAAVGCAGCHSSQGAGGIGPALDGNPSVAEERYVVDTILTGGKQMPAFGPFLTDGQVAALATHVRTAWGNDYGSVDSDQVIDLRQPEDRGRTR